MILVDTNVISQVFKSAPDRKVIRWLDQHFSVCSISAIAILELQMGVAALPAGKRRDELDSTVSRVVRRFGARIVPFDREAADAAARLFERSKASGKSLHQVPGKLADLQIGGSAIARGMSLATRNVADFAGLGVKLINPWVDD